MNPLQPVITTVRQIANRVRQGVPIPWFTSKTIFSKAKLNEVLAVVNALANPKSNPPGALKITISDTDVMYDLRAVASNSSGSGGMNYLGTYNNANDYSVGDVVRVRSGTSQGIWVCVVGQAAGGSPPVYPEPADSGGSNNWDMLAFGITTFHYKDPSLSCAARKIAINSGVSSSDP